jgi:hypothetical protein
MLGFRPTSLPAREKTLKSRMFLIDWRWPESDIAGNAIDRHVRVLGTSLHDAMKALTSQ